MFLNLFWLFRASDCSEILFVFLQECFALHVALINTLTNVVLVCCIFNKHPSSRAVVSGSSVITGSCSNSQKHISIASGFDLFRFRLHLSARVCGARLSDSCWRKRVTEPVEESPSIVAEETGRNEPCGVA